MNKQSQIKAIRGMNDILPLDSALWQHVETVCADVFRQFGYQQIRTPLVESTQLFARSIGAETDIVSKEMYTFEDRNGDSLTLRPEGTASTVRAGIENGLFYNQQQRLWYQGPMFRHERPQKGRYRQFHQVGLECYGWNTPDIEAEVLSLVAQLFDRLGLKDTELQINSLGDDTARANYRDALVAYLSQHRDALDEDSVRRLTTNPLRILDSKNAEVQALLGDAPNILTFLSDSSAQHFETLQTYLTDLGIAFRINSRLVRGLDYYNDTVFEWVNKDFGAQSTVCGGGRYDGLVAQLGGQSTPAFGFGMGLERLIQILQEQGAESANQTGFTDVFIVSVGEAARRQALILQRDLIQAGLAVNCHQGAGSMKNQFKRADKSGATLALVIGEQEAQDVTASVKPLRRPKSTSQAPLEQQTIAQNDVVNVVTNLLESL
ncbi:histidine--tRNA ligase [Arenicella chitinivorans]|uniref:Histidine--tRNA ligase n=1 Tax=Arenicella chitinivorans TaxID=1329800 RepID=A0A918VLZ6_9GAMM|nr:histidine--tRNA ligase [Arenicella chitinivorans]GHA09207.1 histidine--tRNA ligase [Arenicella chitinivorans]